MTLLSLFQTFGAFVGIVTGVIVLGDRWFKQRPYAVLYGDSPEKWGQRRFWVKIINPSGYPIIVTTKPQKDSFHVGKDENARSAIIAAMGATSTFAVGGRGAGQRSPRAADDARLAAGAWVVEPTTRRQQDACSG